MSVSDREEQQLEEEEQKLEVKHAREQMKGELRDKGSKVFAERVGSDSNKHGPTYDYAVIL